MTIDAEDTDLNEGSEGTILCPVRTPRMHAVTGNVNRLCWVHEALERLWSIVSNGRPPPSPKGHIAPSGRKGHIAPSEPSCVSSEVDPHRQRRRLEQIDAYHDDVWVRDKQGPYWLFDYVRFARQRPPHDRTNGLTDTPASLVLRACDAYAGRFCLAVPESSLLSIPPTRSRARPG